MWHRQLRTAPTRLPARKGLPSLVKGDCHELAADDVQSVVIPGRGHYCLEEAPEQVLAALTEFLASYRDGPAAAPAPGPRAAVE